MVAGSALMQTVTWFEPTNKVIQTFSGSPKDGGIFVPLGHHIRLAPSFLSLPVQHAQNRLAFLLKITLYGYARALFRRISLSSD